MLSDARAVVLRRERALALPGLGGRAFVLQLEILPHEQREVFAKRLLPFKRALDGTVNVSPKPVRSPESMSKTRDLIDRLKDSEPVEPRGWFRWLNNHFLGREHYPDQELEGILMDQGWYEAAWRSSRRSQEVRDALVPVIARHAWSVGHIRLLKIADECWNRLEPIVVGSTPAGCTKSDYLEAVGAGFGLVIGVKSSVRNGVTGRPSLLKRLHTGLSAHA